MTMSGNRDSLPPTWTLARLYEEQNQYMDALAAYEQIRKTSPARCHNATTPKRLLLINARHGDPTNASPCPTR